MISPRKEFILNQYQWVRLEHPSLKVANDRSHPFHMIDLQLAHNDHIVKNLIDDVLKRGNNFTDSDVDNLLEVYKDLYDRARELEGSEFSQDFIDYISCTIKILDSAKRVMAPPTSPLHP